VLLPYAARVAAQHSAVPVLLYHDVTAEPRDPFGVTPSTFARHMQLVAASGRVPLTIDEYADGLRGGPLPDRPVLVTFDDGYAEFPAAVEAMAAAGVDASTIYVTTGWLDRPPYLTWTDAAALPARVQVGSHSRTHPQLDVLPTAVVRGEVEGSKAELEDRLGRPCRSFAYPHGHHDAGVKAAVREAGYDSAAAVRNALSHGADDVLAIARYTVTAATTDERVALVLDGRGIPVAPRRERLRTKVFREYRRARHRIPG
jgi:peptidoglycan/xylan/chitin deacetylase (PgdA/CDA1 family)